MRFWLAILILTGSLISVGFSAIPQEAIVFNDPIVKIEFGEQINFEIRLESFEQAAEVFLSVQPQGESARVKPATITEDGKVIAQYNTRSDPFHPFAQIEYWYSVIAHDGQKFDSPHFYFEYTDNRFVWKSLENTQFEIHWYAGDLTFGQAALNTAEAGLRSAQTYLDASPPMPVRIFIYASPIDLQSGLQIPVQSWVTGHASTGTHIILISIAPGAEQQLEFERQIPHEIMHLLQFEFLGEDYRRIPVWLAEGSASLAELYPNPDYQWALERSAREQTLLPFHSLCTSFPREASGAFLSYAQSASFVRFLHQKFGRSGIQTLMRVYGDGIGCEEGTIAAFGISLGQIENNWQQEVLGMRPGLLAFRNLSPYLSLSALLMLIPLIIGLLALRK
ncbi:MAG: hypothetical protein IT308_00795 [Anaerolineaceae bacterium]|nr:hypothetical protein [Anaerolineaceae bacterium]